MKYRRMKMDGTAGLITVTLSAIGTIIIASIFLNNSFQGGINLLRTDIEKDISVVREDMKLMRTDIRELQDKTSRMDAKLELLIETWGLTLPSPPAVAKK